MTTAQLPNLKAVTEVQPASFAGLSGHARVVSIEIDGRQHYAIAFLAEEQCFSLFGIFQLDSGKEISISDLSKLSYVMEVERYTPVVTPEKIRSQGVRVPDPEPLPLGDARKQAQEGKQ